MKVTKTSIIATLLLSSSLYSTTLREAVEMTLNSNPDIISEHYNKKANRLDINTAESGYYPTLDLTTSVEEHTTYTDTKDDPTDGEEGEKNQLNEMMKQLRQIRKQIDKD